MDFALSNHLVLANIYRSTIDGSEDDETIERKPRNFCRTCGDTKLLTIVTKDENGKYKSITVPCPDC